MCYGYSCLARRCPRSFLFSVVANVGPNGASRSLAVAYRQGNDMSPWGRVDHFVADTLALIEILSDPANRAPLEAERALAEDWYRRSQGCNETATGQRPIIPDTPQPPFVVPDGKHELEQTQPLPELPWYDDELSEFPFTTTCLLLGLLRDDADSHSTNRKNVRPGDVQLQLLSTVFRGDCAEYGLVVLDISDFDSGVKYGIVAFPVRYMAEVSYRGEAVGWDPVEDPPPLKEPDVVLVSPRPRVPLSILQWLGKYFNYQSLEQDPSVLRLAASPLVDAAALDYIWPPELEDQSEVESQGTASSKGDISSMCDYFRPSKSTTRAKDALSTTASPLTTTSHEPPRNEHTDRAIDNLLLLTQEPADLPLDKKTIANFQKLAEFREQLRRRLEEVPDSLGSSEISGHILRVAYAGCRHLNWVAFRNLAPSVIAAAIASDELRGATALSLCVDQFKLEGEGDEGRGDLGDVAAALAQCPNLKQLCFLQSPDRDSDDASARFCTQLLLLWARASGGDLGWLRGKTIYPTCAFSTSLRSREFVTPASTISLSFTSPVVDVFPVIHIFTFVGHQREDAADADADADHHLQQHQNSSRYSYSDYYTLDNTFLDAERFAVRFLSYLHSLGSGSGSSSDKAILRFAYGGPASTTTTTTTVHDDNSPPPWSSLSGRFAVRPIPAGFFDYDLTPNDPARVRLRDIHPSSWVVLVDQQGPSCSSSDNNNDNNIVLQYCFVRICQTSADIAPEQQQQRPVPVPVQNLIEVVGGLTEFLRETVPGIDISTCEKRVEEVEKDLRARRASNSIAGIGVMAESSARALLNQLLWYPSTNYCSIFYIECNRTGILFLKCAGLDSRQ